MFVWKRNALRSLADLGAESAQSSIESADRGSLWASKRISWWQHSSHAFSWQAHRLQASLGQEMNRVVLSWNQEIPIIGHQPFRLLNVQTIGSSDQALGLRSCTFKAGGWSGQWWLLFDRLKALLFKRTSWQLAQPEADRLSDANVHVSSSFS